MRLLSALFALLLAALPATAQDRPNTILVLDGSGSMWGQIDGINKIVIARDVVGTLLDDFPADQNLGLTVYGHRTRGECTDIETVVAPGPGTTGAIRDAVNGINPRGMTPMTDAIIAAAEALRYTEQKATVILVSDGIETCNPDPCAAALALEQAGIDFTAHVVGFDVTDPEALAQMQCLADNTGGTFTTASNADELTQALETVTVAPEPVITTIAFEARIGSEDGPLIADPVIWTLAGANGDATGNPIELELEEGSYDIEAYWTAQETALSRQFIATADPRTIVIVFEEPQLQASVTGPASAPLGSTVEIGWTGPDEDRDYIAVAKPDARGYVNYTYTAEGNPLMLQMPPEAGMYELRYVRAQGSEVIGTAMIEVTPVPLALEAPDTATIGQDIEVTWTGPDYDRDFISVAEVGSGSRYINYTYTREGSPLTLQMPPEPGEYEIRYQLEQDGAVLARRPITVSEAQVSITAPDSATIGQDIEVTWTGPDYDRDFISVAEVGSGGRYVNYTYTREGSPLMLQMPPEPGAYEIRYQLAQDGEILMRRPITVSEAQVSITAPATAMVGARVEIGWTGPDYDRDYISVAVPGGGGGYINYTYTEAGTPLTLQMPPEPGDYEIRYQLEQDGQILFTVPISITPAETSLTGPATATAGSTIEVGWTGPGNPRDYIGVSAADDARGYANYAYVESGNPVQLRIPAEPGAYELRYFLDQDATILARVPLTVTAATATLDAGGSVSLSAGQVMVTWDGPANDGDFLSIGAPGQDGYVNWAYVDGSNPRALGLPDTAGDWEVRYHLGAGEAIIGRVPLTVTAD